MKALGILIATIALVGCSTPKKTEPPKVYSVSFRQTAPAPVYYRLRWVHSPEVIPVNAPRMIANETITPVFRLSLKNTPLDEAALILASTARYAASCPGTECSEKRVTIDALGTTDELAKELSSKTGYKFVVDHATKAIRVGGEASLVNY